MHINILPKEVVQHCSFRNVDGSLNLGNRPVSIYHQNSYFVPRLRGVKQNKSSWGSWGSGINNTLLSFYSCNPNFQLPFTQNILRTFWGGLHDQEVTCDQAFSEGFKREREKKRKKGKSLVSKAAKATGETFAGYIMVITVNYAFFF